MEWHAAQQAWRRLGGRARTGEAALEALADIGSLRRLLDRAELEAVRDARAARRSWAEIATRLGVTRQSAWERWRDLDDEPIAAAAAELVEQADLMTVPLVIGLEWTLARAALRERGLLPEVADPALSHLVDAEVTAYVVTEQKPAAGERVTRHSTVTVWLRRGPGDAGVPAPLEPPPPLRHRRGAIDETTGESVR